MSSSREAGALNPLAGSSDRHPPGLSTLFFTEMWERFSFYGMRALLVLFMVDSIERGGLGLDDKVATAIYGLYTAFVYLASLPGGWVADRLLGAQRSVWYGGMLIAAGHFTLAIPLRESFFVGLLLIILGTGLLKPNISAIVGHLYPQDDGRRDAGFTIFYMGINVGAALGPLVCSTLGEKLNWHAGFAAAGVGMLFALAYFQMTKHRLGTAGLYPAHGKPSSPSGIGSVWSRVVAVVGLVGLAAVLGLTGGVRFNPVPLAENSTYLIVGIGAAFLMSILVLGRLTIIELKRIAVLVLLMMAAALFWAGFEQAGSSLNLFAERYTVRAIPGWQFEVPAGWFQSLNAVFIVALSPLIAALWATLNRRGQNPSIPAKFAWGLILLGLGFLVMYAGSRGVGDGRRALPTWLIGTYFLHTVGELCLSPVGLSAVSKLAPQRYVGQMMGLWFLATSLGNLLAGLFASKLVANVAQMPATFLRLTAVIVGAGILLLFVSRPISRWGEEQEPRA